MKKYNILLIGAGAVGLVYGKHLVDAGHTITFLVREKHRKDLQNGAVLYPMNKDKSLKHPFHFKNFAVMTTFEEVKQTKWDQIWLCFSSTALQSYDFKGLKEHVLGDPTIVMLQPGTEDFDVLNQTFPADQIVEGMISLISYHTPMATETTAVPGTAYWFPPMMPTPFSGPTVRRDEVIESFQKGGITAKASPSVRLEALFPSAFLGAFITALEAADWKFPKLRQDKNLLCQLQKVNNEIFTALEAKYKTKRPKALLLINKPITMKILLRLAPKVMPMDIETYLEAHFTKVKSQTKLYLANHLTTAKEMGTPHETITLFNELT